MKPDEVQPLDDRPAISAAVLPLAIIGIGCLFPQAADPTAYWANIREGIDAITEIPTTHWKVADYYAHDQKAPDLTYGHRGGFLSPVPFNPLEFNIPPNVLEAVDTSQLLGLVAAGQALRDAGYGPERIYDRSRTSVILGVTGAMELVIPLGARLGHPLWRVALKDAGVEDAVAEDVVQRISDSYVPWQENSFPGLLGNVVAGRISKQYDLGGTNCVVDAACASSFSALHLAGMELATGKADMVVTGGIDTFNDIFMYMCFSKTPALSPSGDAKPFDTAADGTTLGEGLGIVVIKRLIDAERDGDRIYAVIRGVGSSSDGRGDAIYAPSAGGQKKAILDACRRAGVTPESIGLIEAHGTGTKVGDAVEVSALREVYGETETPWCALGSVKSQIGHTKAAAGAAGLIKTALALHHKVIPPTIKVTNPLEELTGNRTPFYLTAEKRPWLTSGAAPRRAAVSAFGFGGSNFHTILEEYRPNKTVADWDGAVQIIPFSAVTAGELESALATLPADLPWNELRDRAVTARKTFDSGAPCRLALVVERDRTKLSTLVANALTMLRTNTESSGQTPDGAFFATGDPPGKIAVLFPGQGAQYTGMLRDLACGFPEVFSCLAAADAGYGSPGGIRLSDYIYPPTAYSPGGKEHQEELLRTTDVAQPAIGAVSLGALRLLESFGLAPNASAGHSYGELTALCAAGKLNESTFHHLSRLRGGLMASGNGDRGGMLAVPAPLAIVEQVLAEEGLDLIVANRNAPSQAVLSGGSAEIDRAIGVFASRKLVCKRLPVSAAFHSPLVADAAEPFLAALSDVVFGEARFPVYANTTAAPYPDDQDAVKTLLAGQLAQPVEFMAEIEALHASGIRTFLEVGPGARLTGLVKAILGDRIHVALALDTSNGKRSGIADLARTLAHLAVLGYNVRLDLWDAGHQPAPLTSGKKSAMTIPICGANYVKPKPKRPPAVVNRGLGAERQGLGAGDLGLNGGKTLNPEPLISRELLTESLRVTRESMAVLQQMQEETAQLHRRFLEGQEAAGRTIQSLLDHQIRVLHGGGVVSPSLPTSQATPPWGITSATTASPTPAHVPMVALSPVVAPFGRDALQCVSTISASSPGTPGVTETLLAVVSEKTGYPVEMLELEMGLDSDLGIDSIKRVEILSALQERLPAAPVIGPEQMGNLRTLGDIAAFLGAGRDALPCVSTTPASSLGTLGVTETLLAVVSEKTGYPVEMLELEMGLDSDLGIDSIKRVEILSALQERLPAAPVIGPEQMGNLRTLGDIAEFLGTGRDALPCVSTPSGITTATTPGVAETLLAVVSDKTSYPVEILELEMGLDSDLGIDTIKPDPTRTVNRSAVIPVPLDPSLLTLATAQKGQFWVTDDGSPFSGELARLIRARGQAVRLVDMATAEDAAPTSDISGLVIITPHAGADEGFLEDAFLLLKSAAPALRRAAASGGALFTTVSRLDGSFGFGSGTSLVDPLSGGLAGLAKTAAREWPEVSCKAIDLGGFSSGILEAGTVIAELFTPGPVEVGLTPAGRISLRLSPLPAATLRVTLPVNPGEVVIVTGGGRGVTAAAATALAKAYRPLLVLLGRSPEPVSEPSWLSSLTDESRIKRAILDRAGEKLSPREIEARYQAVIAGRELRATLACIEATGGQAVYRSLDIRDAGAVRDLLYSIRLDYGPIRGIVHGAGVLADRLIIDKTRDQFAEVLGAKVTGLRTLLAETEGDELRFIALFASTTGRFGRTGQADYAVANEVLNKLAQAEARRRPGCRTVSINWGPWDGGMVTPALKKVFAKEGVGLIGLAEGGELLVREIAASDAPAEVVALSGTHDEITAQPNPNPAQPLAEALSLTLTVDGYPFLRSHVIDGKAVLPMAVIVEWLAHGALHGNPGFRFHGFNDLRICKGVIFDRQTPCTLRVMAGRAARRESFHLVPVELRSTGPNGSSLLHARAEIVLATRLPEGIRSIGDLPATPYEPHNGEIYHPERLFHGPDLHGIEQVLNCSRKGITALVKGAPKPSTWIRQPLRSDWLTDPLVVDSAFQLMILWSFERFNAGSLPTFAERYRQFTDSFPRDGVQVVIRVTSEREHGATANMEFLDRNTGKLVARLTGYECVIDPSLQRAFQHNELNRLGAA